MAVFASTPVELVEGVYATLDERVGRARESFGRPLTLAEKVLVNHLDPSESGVPERGVSYTAGAQQVIVGIAPPIPPELATLTNVDTIYLADNELSGPIPAWLVDLINLGNLNLANNQFSGPPPPAAS